MKKIDTIVYDIKQRAETVTKNELKNDTRYSGWKAINIGTVPVIVDGVPLQPGEGIEHKLEPNERWTEPIDIKVESGGKLRLLRKLCTPKIVTVIQP